MPSYGTPAIVSYVKLYSDCDGLCATVGMSISSCLCLSPFSLLCRFDVVNVTEENDTRLMPRHELSKTWTHEEIWDLILNGGMNANPADVPMRTYDPGARADYFSEGIKYVPLTKPHKLLCILQAYLLPCMVEFCIASYDHQRLAAQVAYPCFAAQRWASPGHSFGGYAPVSPHLAVMCRYFPETDEWLASIGHLWEDEAEPDVGQEVSMLASDFSDINVGNNTDDTDDASGEPDNEDEPATVPDDEASELGNLFGPTDL